LQGDKDEETVTEVAMYNLLAIFIVIVAIAYIIRTFYKRLKNKRWAVAGVLHAIQTRHIVNQPKINCTTFE